MTKFWQGWLTLWCVGVGAFGAILYGVGFPAATAPAAAVFSAFGNPLPAEPDRYLRFAISLMGAVTLGWAITYYAAFRAAWTLHGETSAIVWRILTIGTVAWYVIDSLASIANGFGLNAVSNTGLLIAFSIPVLATRVLRVGAASDSAAGAGQAAR